MGYEGFLVQRLAKNAVYRFRPKAGGRVVIQNDDVRTLGVARCILAHFGVFEVVFFEKIRVILQGFTHIECVCSGSPVYQRQGAGPADAGPAFNSVAQVLEDPRGAHAATDAHGDHAVAVAATLHLVEQLGRQLGAGGSERMA